MPPPPLSCDGVEGEASGSVSCLIPSERLPAPDNGVDIEGIDLEPVTAPPCALRCNDCGAAAEKWIKDNLAPGRGVHDRVRHHGDGLYRWVQGEEISFPARPAEIVDGRIGPDIGAMAAVLPELYVVPVPSP